jgi:hypothetical protein
MVVARSLALIPVLTPYFAAASMLTEVAADKDLNEALEIVEHFRLVMHGDAEPDDEPELDVGFDGGLDSNLDDSNLDDSSDPITEA